MIRVHEEVHSESVAVDLTQHVHQPCLDPTSIHATDDVEYTNRPVTLALLASIKPPSLSEHEAIIATLPTNWTIRSR